MDMTPMIDVVFLLIVFFLCIEFKVLESRLDAFLPSDVGSRAQAVLPEEQLVVRVLVAEEGRREAHGAALAEPGRPQRYRLIGHRARYEVGPVACGDIGACERELRRLAADPSLLVPDRAGGKKRMRCVVEGLPGSRYDDVAQAADLCRDAGFDDITFGGGMGPR